MPNASPSQTSFNAGLLSNHLDAREDVPKFGNGCSVLDNLLPEIEGPATKRPGNKFIAPQGDETSEANMIDFQFSVDQTYQLEFGNNYVRVFRNKELVLDSSHTPAPVDGVVAANPLEIVASVTGLATGDSVFITGTNVPEINDQFFSIALTGTGFTLKGVDGTTFPAQGVTAGTAQLVYSIVSPYSGAQVQQIQTVQSADVLYIAHRQVQRQKLSRLADDNWVFAELTGAEIGTNGTTAPDGIGFESWPPFARASTDGSKLQFAAASVPAGTLGAVLDSDTAGTFTADDVGRFIKLQADSAHMGYALITSFVNDQQVLVTSYTNQPDGGAYWSIAFDVCSGGSGTSVWAFSAFDHVNGYPQAVAIWESRAIWGSTDSQVQSLWLSGAGDLENNRTFENSSPGAAPHMSIEPDSAIEITLDSEKLDAIEWVRGLDTLFIGTRGGEWVLKASDQDLAIAPGNIEAKPIGRVGSRKTLQPTIVDSVLLFVQRAGRKLKELVFDQATQSYRAPDMTRLSRNATIGRILATAYQQEPNKTFWAAMENGDLASFTYERLDDVTAWALHPLGGSGLAESVSTSSSVDNDEDEIWLTVARTINGQPRRFVEVMQTFWDRGDVLEDAFYVDAGVKYDSTPATEFYGLLHLVGEEVKVFADGASQGAFTVDAHGRVTLSEAASKVIIGLPYKARLRTMRNRAGAADGTAQGKTKRIQRLIARFEQTGPGVFYGPDFDDMKEFFFRDPTDPMDTPIALFNGDTESQAFPGGHNQEGYVAIEHDEPTPFTLLGLFPQLETHDRG
jgi:hypothetical protein